MSRQKSISLNQVYIEIMIHWNKNKTNVGKMVYTSLNIGVEQNWSAY